MSEQLVKLELTREEFSSLAGLLDTAVKATGLRSVKSAAKLLEKIEAAAETLDA